MAPDSRIGRGQSRTGPTENLPVKLSAGPVCTLHAVLSRIGCSH